MKLKRTQKPGIDFVKMNQELSEIINMSRMPKKSYLIDTDKKIVCMEENEIQFIDSF